MEFCLIWHCSRRWDAISTDPAGSAGAIVLFITALVAWPLTYWPHKALSQFILSANIAPGTGITAQLITTMVRKLAT